MPKRKLLFLVAAIIAIPSAAWAVGFFRTNTSGVAPEAMRTELAGVLVKQWAPYVEKTYGTSGSTWASRMKDTLSRADISNLERAVAAPSYSMMTTELLGNGTTMTASTADRIAPKALGSSGSDLVYTPVNHCRIVDTREVGGPMGANETRMFKGFTTTNFTAQGGAASTCNIPVNASALSMSVTSVLPTFNGYFTVYPSNEAKPLATSLNYNIGMILSSQANARLCRPACDSQFNVYSLNQSHLVIDVEGYFMEPEATALDCTVAQQSGNLALFGGLQPKFVNCPAGYTATGGGCGGPLGISVSNSEPNVVGGSPVGWKCDMVGSLLSIISYQVNATCCRVPGR